MTFKSDVSVDKQLDDKISFYLKKNVIVEEDIPWIHVLMNKIKDSDRETYFKLRNLECKLKK